MEDYLLQHQQADDLEIARQHPSRYNDDGTARVEGGRLEFYSPKIYKKMNSAKFRLKTTNDLCDAKEFEARLAKFKNKTPKNLMRLLFNCVNLNTFGKD